VWQVWQVDRERREAAVVRRRAAQVGLWVAVAVALLLVALWPLAPRSRAAVVPERSCAAVLVPEPVQP
jgi:hypothetical protein